MALNLYGIDLGGTAVSSGQAASSAQIASTTQSSVAQASNASQQLDPSVSITSTASLLARLQQAFAAESPVDPKRVDAITRALAAGTYGVRVDRIAEGLIHLERALGQLTEI